jgi:murein DD-endopeptidase MepM/ murein hydrolase activator NlpD
VLGSRNFVLARSVSPIPELPITVSEVAAQTVELRVHPGDTLIALLSRVGATLADAHAAAEALETVFHPREIRPGLKVQVTLHPQDEAGSVVLQSVAFRPSVERDVEVVRTTVDGDDRFMAHTLDRTLHQERTLSSGTIDDSLFNAGAQAGVPHDLLLETIKVLSYEVDFQRDIRAGDQFELLYDTYRDDDGEMAKSGAIDFAKLTLSGKEMSFYRFTPKSGVADLFSADGKSIRRALLPTPVDATRISSGFGMRIRSGYNASRRRLRGCRSLVNAARQCRRCGFGSYGNYVRIGDSSYARLMHTATVRAWCTGPQSRPSGDISYVGATDCATGPHLH